MPVNTLKFSLVLVILLAACDRPAPGLIGAVQASADIPLPTEQVDKSPLQQAAPEPEPQAVPETQDAKPYQVVDGKISENVMEGWRTYNGGGCGTCHGKGGIGAVGPNLANSLQSTVTKEQFFDLVENGKPGTMMRPNNTNKRVMDNLENLYAYLLARSDGVLGPENLIKFPLGKSE